MKKKITKADKQIPTIKTLEWNKMNGGFGGEYALAIFSNGYGASVLRGGLAYTRGGTYEIAVLHKGDLCYDTPITSNVLGYLTEKEANATIKKISALPKRP